MWNAEIERPTKSCSGIPQPSFARQKLDINSIEYQSYIRKDVLGFLDKYSRPSKNPKMKKSSPNARAATAGNANDKAKNSSPGAKCKPVYIRIDKPKAEGSKSSSRSIPTKTPRKNKQCECSKPVKKVLRSDIDMDQCNNKRALSKCQTCEEGRKRSQSPVRITELNAKSESSETLSVQKVNVATPQPKEITKRHPVLYLRKKCPQLKIIMPAESVRSTSSRFLVLGIYKIFLFGEKGSGFKSRGEPQDFYKLRDQCLDSGTLFEDPEFPATDSSLFFSHRPDRYYEWKRPHEICDNPQFFVEGYSRFDVQQGELGDCWLLAAAANLTMYNRLFLQIVPDDQDFDDKYAGIFHFRFWQYGRWVEVVIDDRLPTYNGQLVFLHSTEENEFWSALLEKAYAKLHGSYEALKGGSTCEAMEDFTGGVTEMYELDASPPNLFQIMLKGFERASLMGCSIEPDPNIVEAETPEGLIRGHAYSITRVQFVDIQTPNVTGKIPLLRLRNPWGNESEWNGAWSDGSPEWRFISESEKEELGLTFDHDGEFWMSFKDFQKYFSRIEICNLNPDSLTDEELREGHKKKWEMSVFEGEWVRGVTAGGCRNFLDSFWHNPQYRITLTEVDEDDEDGSCTLIVALMQKNRRQIRSTGVDLLTIGFAIYHLPYPDRVPKPLDVQFFKYNASVARSPSFINLREVSCRFKLPPGTYCIVPSTFDPNEEGEFLLRIFTENRNIMEENDQEIGFGEPDEQALAAIPEPDPGPVPRSKLLIEIEPRIEKVVVKKPQMASLEPSREETDATDKVQEMFLKLAGEDKEVDWQELKEILDYSMRDDLTKNGFSKDICRSMIAMMDKDRSGRLGFEEFKALWESLRNWKNVWIHYDADRSGSFSGFELREALYSAGYRLNNHILNALMHRYGNKQGQIQFDDFMMCAIKVKTMIDVFEAKDKTQNDAATFSLEEWLETTLCT